MVPCPGRTLAPMTKGACPCNGCPGLAAMCNAIKCCRAANVSTRVANPCRLPTAWIMQGLRCEPRHLGPLASPALLAAR